MSPLDSPDSATANLLGSAEKFCEWVESEQHSLMEARQLLLDLMATIPSLQHFRDAGTSEADFPRRGFDGWERDYRTFSGLPFQCYQKIFDPHCLDSADEPVLGDLYDDLADIYGDLWHGLQAYQSGDLEEAISLWVDSYFSLWGGHASYALRAIDTYYCENLSINQQGVS